MLILRKTFLFSDCSICIIVSSYFMGMMISSWTGWTYDLEFLQSFLWSLGLSVFSRVGCLIHFRPSFLFSGFFSYVCWSWALGVHSQMQNKVDQGARKGFLCGWLYSLSPQEANKQFHFTRLLLQLGIWGREDERGTRRRREKYRNNKVKCHRFLDYNLLQC